MRLSESDRLLADVIKRSLREWRIYRWFFLLGGFLLSISGCWMLRIIFDQGLTDNARIGDVLLAVAGSEHCIAGGLILLYTTAFWKGSRIQRLLLAIVDADCEHNEKD